MQAEKNHVPPNFALKTVLAESCISLVCMWSVEEEVEEEVWGVSCLQLWTLLETNDVTRPEAERERES